MYSILYQRILHWNTTLFYSELLNRPTVVFLVNITSIVPIFLNVYLLKANAVESQWVEL